MLVIAVKCLAWCRFKTLHSKVAFIGILFSPRFTDKKGFNFVNRFHKSKRAKLTEFFFCLLIVMAV